MVQCAESSNRKGTESSLLTPSGRDYIFRLNLSCKKCVCVWRHLFISKYCIFYLYFHGLISLIYSDSELWNNEYFKYSELPLNIPQFQTFQLVRSLAPTVLHGL